MTLIGVSADNNKSHRIYVENNKQKTEITKSVEIIENVVDNSVERVYYKGKQYGIHSKIHDEELGLTFFRLELQLL